MLMFLAFLFSGVLCTDWSVKMPQSLQTVSGSCVLIPCTFYMPHDHASNLISPAFGVWRKGSQWFTGSVDVFNSSRTQNILHGKIIGDLIARNCTSILYNLNQNFSDRYYFRLETGFKITFANGVNITIAEFPPKPTVSPVGAVVEGTHVNLSCTAPSPCPELPPTLTWSPQLSDSSEKVLKNEEGTLCVTSAQSFVASHHHHGLNITCAANYSLQTTNMQSVSLTVLFAPKLTKVSVSPSGPIMEGTQVTLLCSCSGNPPAETYTWFQLRGDQKTALGPGQNFTFNATDVDAAWYICEARNQHGAQNSSAVQLVVKGQEEFVLWGLVLGGVALLMMLLVGVLLCLCRNRKLCKLTPSKSKKDEKSENVQVYANMRSGHNQKRPVDTVDQSRQEGVHGHCENLVASRSQPPGLTVQSASADDCIYANSLWMYSKKMENTKHTRAAPNSHYSISSKPRAQS